MPGTFVHDITAATFQQDVIAKSSTRPVLLDFHASWCGPCKVLGPILERLAAEYGGAFELGKVDSDKEQDLAYAFGVQGIPYCVLVDGGRPVDAFTGAQPEAEVRRFLQRNGVEPMVAAPAAKATPAPVDPNSPAARLGRARAAAGAGDAAGARQALAEFKEEDERHDEAERLLTGLEWLEAKLDAAGPGAERLLAAARQKLLARDVNGAMTALLESVQADKAFRGGLARKGMLLCFAIVGEDQEQLDDYRRRLATLLY